MRSQLRRNRRGNAAFAAIAVALLLLGAAAAVIRQGADLEATDARERAAADAGMLEMEVAWEADALSALLGERLEGLLDRESLADGASFALLSQGLEADVRDALADAYPRVTAAGHTIEVALEFARAAPQQAEVEMPSPFGGRSPLRVPAYLAAEGLATVTVSSGGGANYSALVAFATRSSLPVLLPLSIGERFVLESLPGGRVERIAGQVAKRVFENRMATGLNASEARSVVSLALGAEAALDFGSSGNATLDQRLAGLQGTRGGFRAGDLAGLGGGGPETFSLEGVDPTFSVEGESAPLRLVVEVFDTGALVVHERWRYFASQELGNGLNGALEIAVEGEVALAVRVEAPGGSRVVGPLRAPVVFSAHAFQGGLEALDTLDPALVEAAVADLRANGSASRFALALSVVGIEPDAAGNYTFDGPTLRALADAIVAEQGTRFPPVENLTEFARASSARSQAYAALTLSLDAPADINGSRVEVSVDGIAAASAVVAAGAVNFPRFPVGFHTVEASVLTKGTTFAGRAESAVGAAGGNLRIEMAPLSEDLFLRLALEQGGANASAGLSMLAAGANLAGLTAPSGFSNASEAAAFAGECVRRLEVLRFGALAAATERERAKQAQGFLKIVSGLLEAADRSYKASTGRAMPIGGFAGNTALLVIQPDARRLVSVSVASAQLAVASVSAVGVSVGFFAGGTTVRSLEYRVEEIALVGQALGGAVTLATDALQIEEALEDGDTTRASLLVVRTAGDFGKVALGIAKSYYTLFAAGALKEVLPLLTRLAVAVSAFLLVLDLALLYHEYGGNLSAITSALLSPADVGGLLRLPGLVGSAVSVALSLYALAVGSSLEAGPLGLAVGLFTLAVLLVFNKEKVASAIYGTIDFDQLAEIRFQAGAGVAGAFRAAALANSADLARLAHGARLSSAKAAAAWLDARLSPGEEAAASLEGGSAVWRQRAGALSLYARGALELRHRAAALAEELDDFATMPYATAEGRWTEGYRWHHELRGDFPYRGDVEVYTLRSDLTRAPLGRDAWRLFLTEAGPLRAASFGYDYNLTSTNAIPQSEFALWAGCVADAADALTEAVQRLQQAALALEALGAP